MIEVSFRHRLGGFALDIGFEAPSRGVTALFGRSGAGKTTTINVLAGLLRPDSGRVVIDDEVLLDTATGVSVPPERRRIGMVFQESRLFPHMNVAGNLRYGRRRSRSDTAAATWDQVVALLDLGALLDRRPQSLSGGERQRVAIGRALLASPRLLLMDEPLASLDAARKAEVLPFLERLRDELKLPIIYVSHAMDEVMRLADTMVLISDGGVAATGPVEELTSRLDLRPLTGRYEAGSVITATVGAVDAEFGLTHLDFPGGTLRVARTGLPSQARLRIRVRARDVSLALAPPEHISILNVLPATVVEIGPALADLPDEPGESQLDVLLDAGVPLWARITRRSAHDLALAPGLPVYAMIKAIAIDRHSFGLAGDDHDEPGAAEPLERPQGV